MTEAMPAFVSDLLSAALFESWRAAAVAVVLFLGSCATGLLVVTNTVARPALRALAGMPLLFVFGGTIGILVYLLGGTVRQGLTVFMALSLAAIAAAFRRWRATGGFFTRPQLRRCWRVQNGVQRELALLVGLLLVGFLLAFFGWGETRDGTVRALSGAWGDGPLHVLMSEAFVRRGPTSSRTRAELSTGLRGASGGDLSMPAFVGEQLREPFGYDFVAAMLRSAGFTVGGAFTLPAAGLLACLLGWAGHLAARLAASLRAEGAERDRSEAIPSVAESPRGLLRRFAPRNDRSAFAAALAGTLLLSFGGLQWLVMATRAGAWSPARFFGVHTPVWDKAEDLGLIWANHLNTLVSQKHLLLASAFLLVLAAVLLSTTGRGGDAEEGIPPRGQNARGPSLGRTDRTRSVPDQRVWGIAAGPQGWEVPPRQDPLGRLLPFAIATGLLPLFHAHAFLAAGLLWATAFLRARSSAVFWSGVLAALLALPAIFWQFGLFSRAGFLSFAPGWMAAGRPLGWFWFWVQNLGVFLVVLVFAIWGGRRRREPAVVLLGIPAGVLFLLANLVQFQPYPWDNFKIFLLAWLLALPLVAAEMARWRFAGARALVACLLLLMSLTTLSELATHAHFRAAYPAYEPADRAAARVLDRRLPRDAVVLAETETVHNHPLTLTGRTLVAGYGGWLWTRNYAWETRLRELEALRGEDAARACALAQRLGVTHVVRRTGEVTTLAGAC